MLRPVCFIDCIGTTNLLTKLQSKIGRSSWKHVYNVLSDHCHRGIYLNDLQKFHQLRCFGYNKSQSFSSYAKLPSRALYADCRIDVLPSTWYQLKSIPSLLRIWYVIFCRNSWKLCATREEKLPSAGGIWATITTTTTTSSSSLEYQYICQKR